MKKTTKTWAVCITVLSMGILLLLAGCGGGGPMLPSNNLTGGGSGESGGTGGNGTSNPVPSIISLSPASVLAGVGNQTVTIIGTGFVSGITTAALNGATVLTNIISDSKLTINIPAVDTASAGTLNITVSNPSPGGGTSLVAIFTVNNPAPTITQVTASPSPLIVGMTMATLTITGSGFVSNISTLSVGGTTLTPSSVSATQITVSVNAGELTQAGNLAVSVTNGGPGGGTSNINQQLIVENPAATITGITPNTLTLGAQLVPSSPMTITGTGFVNGVTVFTVNGASLSSSQYTFINSTSIIIPIGALPASLASTAGTISVIANNPAPGGGAGAINFTVNNPAPSLTAVSPASMSTGASSATLTVTGSNFVMGAVVNFNGAALSTTFNSSTSLTATLPDSDLASASSNDIITVNNPAPADAGAGSLSFSVLNPAPTLMAMNPTFLAVNTSNSSTIDLTVQNLVSSGFGVTFNGTPMGATVLNSSGNMTTLAVTLSAGQLQTAGVFPIQVSNATPGGGTSNELYFTVGTPTQVNGGIAVLPETVDNPNGDTSGDMLDVAFVPESQVSGNETRPAEILVVQLDTLDPVPFYPANGIVSLGSADTVAACGAGYLNCDDVIIQAIPLTAYGMSSGIYTVADPNDGLVLVGSVSSNTVVVLNAAAAAEGKSAVVGSYSVSSAGSLPFSDSDDCTGICSISVDTSGISGRTSTAFAALPGGFQEFNPLTGSLVGSTISLTASSNPGEQVGYDSTTMYPNLKGLINAYYTPAGQYGLQYIDLANGNAIVPLTNSVGLRPDSAALDPLTQLAVIPDEANGQDALINFNPGGTGKFSDSATILPAISFSPSNGQFCDKRFDFARAGIDPLTHLLFSAQEFSICVAVTQLAQQPVLDGSGNAITPSTPGNGVYGEIGSIQGPGGTAASGLDPDGLIWDNQGDPHRIAIYTSVLTGQPMALITEVGNYENGPTQSDNDWLAEINMNNLLSQGTGNSISLVNTSQLDKATTFLRLNYPVIVLNSQSQKIYEVTHNVATGQNITVNGSGFICGPTDSNNVTTIIDSGGLPVPLVSCTPTQMVFSYTFSMIQHYNFTISNPGYPGSGQVIATQTITVNSQ